MSNLEKLKSAFAEGLVVDLNEITLELSYQNHPQWDSTAHMLLIAAIENQFDLLLSTDEIIDLSSFTQAIYILQQHHVNFD